MTRKRLKLNSQDQRSIDLSGLGDNFYVDDFLTSIFSTAENYFEFIFERYLK